MQTNQFFKMGLAALFALAIAACSSTDTDMEPEEDTGGMEETDSGNTGGATSSGVDSEPQMTAAEMREQQMREDALDTTVFYFEFDRSDLSQEARDALVYHAEYLMQNPSVDYRLEGHADERGTREYNLALGERRAQAVERYLQVQGVPARQLETISYGEERPADPRSNEEAWALNRRVEIVVD